MPKMSSGSIVGSKHVDQRKFNKIELERNVQKTNKNLASGLLEAINHLHECGICVVAEQGVVTDI